MVDLRKAHGLLSSAKALFKLGDLAGVAGLAYQAFEAAIIVLSKINNNDKADHVTRRKKAEEILGTSEETMRKLWCYRSVDFYGNEKVGGEEKELTEDEIKYCLDTIEDLINKIEEYLK
ncbi:MAG: hypothetical protein ABIH82_01665 [Candidatus Woesearchaeota archaeon]